MKSFLKQDRGMLRLSLRLLNNVLLNLLYNLLWETATKAGKILSPRQKKKGKSWLENLDNHNPPQCRTQPKLDAFEHTRYYQVPKLYKTSMLVSLP